MDWNKVNSQYIELFGAICQNCEVSIEKTLDFDENKKDAEQTKKIIAMRDDIAALHDKLSNRKPLEQKDWTKLYVCALTSKLTIQNNIKTWEKVLNAYDNDLLPKLSNVVEAKATDESISTNFEKLPE